MECDERLRAALDGSGVLLEDGASGTMLASAAGATPGEPPFRLNLANPDAVTAMHRAYVEAGSQAVMTNTFGATRHRAGDDVEAVNRAAVTCARASGAPLVAGDIGPIGELLEPFGDLEEGEALALFEEHARVLDAAGCDLFAVETMTDVAEAALAVRAIRSVSARPLFVTLSFGEAGRTFMGATPADAVRRLAPLGVQGIGANCSVGPDLLGPIIDEMAQTLETLELGSARPALIAKPNAGLPERTATGETRYPTGPDAFAAEMLALIERGAAIVGGCCGTTPDHIRALAAALARR